MAESQQERRLQVLVFQSGVSAEIPELLCSAEKELLVQILEGKGRQDQREGQEEHKSSQLLDRQQGLHCGEGPSRLGVC